MSSSFSISCSCMSKLCCFGTRKTNPPCTECTVANQLISNIAKESLGENMLPPERKGIIKSFLLQEKSFCIIRVKLQFYEKFKKSIYKTQSLSSKEFVAKVQKILNRHNYFFTCNYANCTKQFKEFFDPFRSDTSKNIAITDIDKKFKEWRQIECPETTNIEEEVLLIQELYSEYVRHAQIMITNPSNPIGY